MPDKPLDLPFPAKGINVTTEFQQQPPGTTPVGENVRTFEPIAQRARGGARPGMVKYIPQRIPEGPVLIQHLNFVVDPDYPALIINFDVPGDDWTEDPKNPGIFIPPGGTGHQPNPNVAPQFEGGFEVIGLSNLQFGGETPGGGGGGTAWTATIAYEAGFGDLEVDPGTETIQLCDANPAEDLDWNGRNISFNDIADSTAFHAWLVEEGYVGGGTTPGDVIANYTLNDMGPC